MIEFISTTEDYIIIRQLKKNNTNVDLTGATYSVKLKELDGTEVLSLTGTTLSASSGWYKITVTGHSSLNNRTYYCNVVITISTTDYDDSFYIKFTDKKGISSSTISHYGTTANRPTFASGTNIGFEYFDTTINSPIWWNGTEWV